ncbi:Fur family transcriptional regulator [Desulfonatronovibrio hydrogenovorans]|uniref:Fur family transcriptional regulator n=1 Tax=Desulfonatronovibrio hydrogenovorans TaxID=53245 RepID=UPI00048C6348|nr:transcriptional repressor [Desulfonatronovibrio hydrogenovorans]
MKHNTRQRQAIIRCLRQAHGPMNPQEVHQQAGKEVVGLGIATVYRNLKLLAEDGKIRELAFPGEGSRYEIAGLEHHHHFLCRDCDKVFCIQGCPGGLSSMTPEGFSLEGHEIVLYGRCSHCRMSVQA